MWKQSIPLKGENGQNATMVKRQKCENGQDGDAWI